MGQDTTTGQLAGQPAFTRRTFAQLLAAAGAGCITLDTVAGEPPVPLGNFFQNPAFGQPRFSPDGKFVAVGVAAKSGRVQLVVIDVSRLTAKVVASYTDSDVTMYQWVNADRLVGGVTEGDTAPGDMRFGSGLFAVDRNGENDRRLGFGVGSFFSTTRQKTSDDIFVQGAEYTPAGELHHTELYRLNTRTGRQTRLKGPDFIWSWVLDQDDQPRVAVTVRDGRRTVLYNDVATGSWRELDARGAFDSGGFRPYAVMPDGTLLVTAREGGDTSNLYRFDLAANRVGETVVAVKGYDFDGSLVVDDRHLLGVLYTGDATSVVWLDDRLKALQQKVDALLPNTINVVSVPSRGERKRALVNAYSDREPGAYHLYDTVSGELTLLGRRMRDIDPRQMGKVEPVRYKARDGLEIPAWLSLPPGGGNNLPMVVLVHGGPYVRGRSWRWQPDAHFLASRGYAVLEPEFRGSTGFGAAPLPGRLEAVGPEDAGRHRRRHPLGHRPGRRRSEAHLHRRRQLRRLCHPDGPGQRPRPVQVRHQLGRRHRHRADVHGQLERLRATSGRRTACPSWSATASRMPSSCKATSPLQQAARITQPLLLAYGGGDRRVPIVHGTRFREAVEKVNPNVEWIEYRLEGHGWSLVQNRIDFWMRVEAFLARHIGPAAA